MDTSRARALFASLVGVQYRELPPGVTREDIYAALAAMGARKVGESATPALEVRTERYRIGRTTLRVCTEDEMSVSLWGPAGLIDRLVERLPKRG